MCTYITRMLVTTHWRARNTINELRQAARRPGSNIETSVWDHTVWDQRGILLYRQYASPLHKQLSSWSNPQVNVYWFICMFTRALWVCMWCLADGKGVHHIIAGCWIPPPNKRKTLSDAKALGIERLFWVKRYDDCMDISHFTFPQVGNFCNCIIQRLENLVVKENSTWSISGRL
jgi:hypothetical protein